MNKSKYKLVPAAGGDPVTFGDDNTVTFGGDWGRYDEQGSPLYIWQDNTPSQDELNAETNSSIDDQIVAIEMKQLRALREKILYENNPDKKDIYDMALSKLQDYENQIEALRAQKQ